MIPGFRSADGTWRPRTRFGSTTYFQGRESIEMGDNVYIAQHCFIDGSCGLKIGEGCQVCSFTSLLTHSSHLSIRLYGDAYGGTDMAGYQKGRVEIGAYTFIGPNTVVMPGTIIGKGSIVSAHSYVKGEFPDFSIISGQPAKVVGDVRELDAPVLREHPELHQHYKAWAEVLPVEGTQPSEME